VTHSSSVLRHVRHHFLTDSVREADWLHDEERAVAAADDAGAVNITHTSVRYGLTGGRVWLLCPGMGGSGGHTIITGAKVFDSIGRARLARGQIKG